ncbi:MAG: hypothetical protein FGM54_00525 [Chitinophagaceae bacterium]|nr:hypothetical protein [Chitinophagaceae bacterium]
MIRIVVLNISGTYEAGMNCCQIRWCATQAWTASGVYKQIMAQRNETIYVIAIAKIGGANVVVGTFCLLGIAEVPTKSKYKKFAFWLHCTNQVCRNILEDIFYYIEGLNPARFNRRWGVRYIYDYELAGKDLPLNCCKNITIEVFKKHTQIPTWEDDKTKCSLLR